MTFAAGRRASGAKLLPCGGRSGVARGAACAARLLLGLGLGLALAAVARGDGGTQQSEYARRGQFDRLQEMLEREESGHALDTRDRHALCYAYSKTKRYDKLMPCLDRLAENVRKGDLRTRLFGLDDATPTIHIMRADALIDLGQYAEAAAQARMGIDWLNKEDTDDKDMMIQCLASLAIAASLDGNRAQAQAAAADLEKVDVGFPHADYANAKAMALGRVFTALGEYQKALDGVQSDRAFGFKVFADNLFSGALFRGQSNWTWTELPRGYMIYKALLETGHRSEAKAGFDEMLKIPQVRSNGEIYWLILGDRARIAEQEGQPDAAIDFYKQAVAVIELQRSTIRTEANKIGFVANKQDIYARLIELLLRSGRTREAFEYIEHSKSRALVDLLANKQDFAVPAGAAKDAALALERYRTASANALAQLPVDLSEPPAAQRNSMAQSVQALAAVAPELASLVSVTPVGLDQILDRLLPDETIVEYYYAGPDLYAVTASRAGVQATRIDNRALEDRIRAFRKKLVEIDAGAIDQAKALYDTLLRPIEAFIGGGSLLVVPHGALHYVPFAALHDGKAFVVQRRALRYLPSASTLRYLKPMRTSVPDAILVLGNPDLGDRHYDLPMAEKEARMIAALLPGSQLLVRAQASESAFKKFAPDFHYLHVASHGEFNADNALQSRLVLSRSGEDDGSLTVTELYGLHLDADLVTLSACETGLGTILSGDDVIGLGRGFLYAGSSNVVASLWAVDDLATLYLMKRFYVHIKGAMPKREALRQAQIETLHEYAHPYYWAAFSITGTGL